MEKFFKRKSSIESSSSTPPPKRRENDLANLPSDPGLRPRILEYGPNDREEVRRAYLQKGPCQPHTHSFPQKMIGQVLRRFNPSWFNDS